MANENATFEDLSLEIGDGSASTSVQQTLHGIQEPSRPVLLQLEPAFNILQVRVSLK